MKWILFFALPLLFACQRSTNYLGIIKTPQTIQADPTPTPEVPENPPAHASKTYQLIEDVVGEVTPPVDILWVIDNSGSMENEQNAVSRNAASFMRSFSQNTKLKWKIGLLSTTPTANPYWGFTSNSQLNHQTLNPVKVFQDAVDSLGINGYDQEASFGPILRNLQKYPDFLTPGAHLALVFVTDEEEQTPDGYDYMAIPKFMNLLLQIKGGEASDISTYGVFSARERCPGEDFSLYGSRWNQFMGYTNGKIYFACDADFGSVLSNIGLDLVKKVKALHPVVLLDVQVIPSSIQVFYNGRKLRPGTLANGGEWIFDPKYHTIEITDPSILIPSIKSITVEFEYQPK